MKDKKSNYRYYNQLVFLKPFININTSDSTVPDEKNKNCGELNLMKENEVLDLELLEAEDFKNDKPCQLQVLDEDVNPVDILIINSIFPHEFLYDTDHPDYTNIQKRKDIFNDISVEILNQQSLFLTGMIS